MLEVDNESKLLVDTLVRYKISGKKFLCCEGTQEYERCNAMVVLGALDKEYVSPRVSAFTLKKLPFSPALFLQQTGRATRPSLKVMEAVATATLQPGKREGGITGALRGVKRAYVEAIQRRVGSLQ